MVIGHLVANFLQNIMYEYIDDHILKRGQYLMYSYDRNLLFANFLFGSGLQYLHSRLGVVQSPELKSHNQLITILCLISRSRFSL